MDKRQLTYESFEVPDPGRIEKVKRFVMRRFPDRTGKPVRVLEFGACSNGLAAQLSREPGFTCYGVDINPRVIPGITFIQADANTFPQFDAAPFDVIFAGEFIEHLFDESAFLVSCREILSPGGYFILTVPNLHFTLNRLMVPFGKMPLFSYAPEHYHLYSRKTISDILDAAGFNIVEIRSSHVLFPARTPAVTLPAFVQKPLGALFEWLGDIFPSFGGHLILFTRQKTGGRQ